MPKILKSRQIQLLLASLAFVSLSLLFLRSNQVNAVDAPLERTVSVQYTGEVRPSVTDSQGRISGLDPTSGEPVYGIPDTKLNFDTDQGNLILESLLDGTYTVRLRGVYDEDYQLTINYMDANQVALSYDLRGFYHTDSTTPPAFTITLDQNQPDTPLVLGLTPPPPQNFLPQPIENAGTKTVLSWERSPDPTVTGYKIYTRTSDQPFFHYLAQTSENTYQTTDPWVLDESPPTAYAVTATRADGTESFFSDIQFNNDRDFDWLTDAVEITLGTALDRADTDGDQLDDYTEHFQYGTNPLLPDTDSDGFTDYQEVQAGSDPLDAEVLPSSCHPPLTGDWSITESCTIPADTAFSGNLIIRQQSRPVLSGNLTITDGNIQLIDNSVLTITATGNLDLDLKQHNLRIQPGSGVKILPGGKIH